MKFYALASLFFVFTAAGCHEQQPKTAAPAAANRRAAPPNLAAPGVERMNGAGFQAIILKTRQPIPQQLAGLKELAAWGAAHGLKGTPFFFVYDGPCDGGPNGWVSDAGLMLAAPTAPGFNADPYELRTFTPPAARAIRGVSPNTSIASMRTACNLIGASEKEFYHVPADRPWMFTAMNAVILHGMKNFTLDEPVTIELRMPHYDFDAKGHIPGPIMPTPFPEPAKPIGSAPKQ